MGFAAAWQLIHELSCSSMFKVIRWVAVTQLVAYSGSLGHVTAIVANFVMSLGHALSKFTFGS